ncbi:MAG: lipopolysaccharide heptosyltransferase II [Limisphaerales bacterium]
MTSSRPAATPPRRRILVRGVNWLGDAVMTIPALQRLREALPEAHVTLLTTHKLLDLWQGHGSLNAVLTFSSGESPWSVAGRLRAEDFQAALVLPNSSRSALEVWLARIPRRIGCARRWRNWLLTATVAPRPGQSRMPKRSVNEVNRLIRLPAGSRPPATHHPPSRTAHQIYDYLYLAAAFGANPEPLAPRLEISAAEIRQAEDALLSDARNKAQGSDPGKPLNLLGLNPGAEYGPAKRWPAASFAAVAREVSRRMRNCLWLAFGGAGDWELCNEVARLAGGGVLNLAGKTSLRQLMALLKLCRVVLTNDTGPMHVAAALGTPVVVPFGSTSPELTGPGLPGDPRQQLLRSDAPCSPCFRRACPINFRCMTGISAERVVAAVQTALTPG